MSPTKKTAKRRMPSVPLVRAAVIAGVLATASASAPAYEVLGAKWGGGTVEFKINPNFPDTSLSGSREEQIQIILCAADAWTAQTRAGFGFQYMGTTTVQRLSERDGVHAVFWSNSDGGDALAATIFAGNGGQATSFDVIFFASSNSSPLRWSGPGEPQSGEFDIGGVATHELGHALGLDHSAIGAATMFASASSRALPMRTLHADDRDGCEFLYGLRTQAAPDVELTSVAPPDGPTSGGNEILLQGVNFTYDSDTELRIGGTLLSTSDWDVDSCGQIRILGMPRHGSGPVSIQVSNTVGSVILEDAYNYGGPAPKLLSISPAEGPPTGGVELTIRGENLEDNAVITVGGNPIGNQQLLDSSTITGVLPPSGVHGSVDVALEQGPSTSILAGAFSYNAFLLEVSDCLAVPGQEIVPADVLVTSPVPLTSISFGLSYDPALLQVSAFSIAGTPAAEAAFVVTDIDNTSGIATFTMSMGAGNPPPVFPAGDGLILTSVLTDISLSALPGSQLPLRIQDGAGSPPTPLSFERAGITGSVRPLSSDGIVLILVGGTFLRGDSNDDSKLDIADAVFILDSLFKGGTTPPCEDGADANDDGVLDISDPVAILRFLFQGGASMPEPYPNEGVDPTLDILGCDG